jgi:membrane associated rhomboid family serine protease
VEHSPLSPWRPRTPEEEEATEAFLKPFDDFAWLTAGMVAVLWWFYAIQLIFGWPLAAVQVPQGAFFRLPMVAIGGHLGWLDPAATRDGEWWRLLGMTFLHHSVLHVAGNTLATYFLGRVIEATLGRAAWVVAWVGGGISAALVSLVFVKGESLGASGAALALLGAAVGFGLRRRQRIPADLRDAFGVDLWVFVLLVALTSVLPMVNWAAHLGGLLFGLPVGLLWPPRVWEPPSERAARNGRALASLGLGLWLASVTVVLSRLPTLGDVVPDRLMRALTAAAERGDDATVSRLVEQLVADFPDEPEWAQLRVGLLMGSEEWDAAILAERELEARWPEFARLDPLADNNLAWALLLARPGDPSAVDEAMRRARASLARVPAKDRDVVRNTLAYAHLLDGEALRALELIRDVMTAKSEKDRGDDIYIEVMALAALGRNEQARTRHAWAQAHHPEGTLHVEAEAELRRRGVLP